MINKGNGAGEDQFFDLQADPYEMNNLIYKEDKQELILNIKNTMQYNRRCYCE